MLYTEANFCKKLEKCQEMDCLGAPEGSEGHSLEGSASVSRMARGGSGHGDLIQAEPADAKGGCGEE